MSAGPDFGSINIHKTELEVLTYIKENLNA